MHIDQDFQAGIGEGSDPSNRRPWSGAHRPSFVKLAWYRLRHVLRTAVTSSSASWFPGLARAVRSVDLEDYGIEFDLGYVPREMYRKPFRIPFGHYLKEITEGQIDLEAINIYTSGRRYLSRTDSHFLDPRSKYKDAWFGAVFVFDNPNGRGFMLKNASGEPGDPRNLRPEAVAALVGADQRLIYFDTLSGYLGWDFTAIWKFFRETFYFKTVGELVTSLVAGPDQGQWLSIRGDFLTRSALTDRRLTKMVPHQGIGSYVGLPNERVYQDVDPWHEIKLFGQAWLRFLPDVGAWVVVYAAGSSFVRKDGTIVDNWNRSDLPAVFDEMFRCIVLRTRERGKS